MPTFGTFLQFYSSDDTCLDHLSDFFIGKYLEIKCFTLPVCKRFSWDNFLNFSFSAVHGKRSKKEIKDYLKPYYFSFSLLLEIQTFYPIITLIGVVFLEHFYGLLFANIRVVKSLCKFNLMLWIIWSEHWFKYSSLTVIQGFNSVCMMEIWCCQSSSVAESSLWFEIVE